MKLLCIIDSLASGGAQRQLTTLAIGLKKKGHEIRFLVYHQYDHFLPLLQEADIPCQLIPPCSYVQRVLAVRRILREGWQDVVLAFLEAASFYAELASIPSMRWGLVVGERLADPYMNKGMKALMRQFHRLADVITCNSYTNKLMLETAFPFLESKIYTIYNTVNLKLFSSSSGNGNVLARGITSEFRIVVAASYQEKKNMMNLARALLILKKKKITQSIVVDWFGYIPKSPTAFMQVKKFIFENDLYNSMRFYPTTRDIAGEYLNADAVGLFSFFEGLPNAVCEGMACGKPILLSNVCDAGNLVQEGVNGFLCNPASPEDIAAVIHRMASLSDLEREKMGVESRKLAEYLFAEEIIIEQYEHILTIAANHNSLDQNPNCLNKVPESAKNTLHNWL
ncbi:MAG: glycosyltransferase [Chlorobiaceae bacterium]